MAIAVAPAVVDVLDRELTAQIARGESPDGEKWQPTQKGNAPLQGAAGALKVAAAGSMVTARLTGPEALHSRGYVRGGITRQIMITQLTSRLSDAIRAAANKAFEAVMTGK